MSRRRVWAWLRMLGGVAVLGVLLWRLGTGAFLDGLARIGPGSVVAALLIGLGTTVSCAWRWALIARRLRLRLPLPTAVAGYYRALFLNAVLPAGVLGDVHRAVDHGQKSGDVGRGVRAVVLERAAGQVVVVAAAGTVVITNPSVVPVPFRGVVVLCGSAVVLAVLALVLAAYPAGRSHVPAPVQARPLALVGFRARAGGRVRATAAWAWRVWRRGVAVAVRDVRAGLSWRTLPGVAGTSVVAFAGHLVLFVVAARTAGVTAPVGTLLPLLVLALLAMGLPVNVGGWGPREGATALLFAEAGLGAAQGVSVAVVYGVLAFVASLPGAGVLLARGVAGARAKFHHPDWTNVMSDEAGTVHDGVVEELPRRAVVRRVVETRLATGHGVFRAVGYLDRTGNEQVALALGEAAGAGTLVRVHSECLTGDSFGSLHCECGQQLGAALDAIAERGAGILVYVRGHEGRGIGLLAKLKAMKLQEGGLDTVEANLALGLPVDARDYRVAAAILHDLGAGPVRLMSNNPHKVAQLERYGIGVCERVPLLVPPNDENIRYLRAKRERLDHLLPHLDRVTG